MSDPIQSAVTICLVPEAKRGPFVFHSDLSTGCAQASTMGFDAVEVFPRSADEIDAAELKKALTTHGIKLAAMGTGAGAVVQKLTLTHPDEGTRRRALDYIKAIIDLAGGFGAPAIIGSMQGNAASPEDREQAMTWLAEALEQLGPRALAAGAPLLIEPLNRYESNLLNRVDLTATWLRGLKTRNIKILADLFHMNIEEASMGDAIRSASELVGHVHFADSNRLAMGMGHSDVGGVVKALADVKYQGYASAEVFPQPDSAAAARQTLKMFRECFPR